MVFSSTNKLIIFLCLKIALLRWAATDDSHYCELGKRMVYLT